MLSALLIFMTSCSESSKEELLINRNTTTKKKGESKKYPYNYKKNELLKISSILLSEPSDENFKRLSRSKYPIGNNGDNNDINLNNFELSSLNLGNEKDNLLVAVKDKGTQAAVILSKDKRNFPIIGYIENYDPNNIPPQMSYFLSEKADNMTLETNDLMKTEGVEGKLDKIDVEVNQYLSKVVETKLKNHNKGGMILRRKRTSTTFAAIFRNHNVANFTLPLIRTQWDQTNTFIRNTPPYNSENLRNVEGCVTTAVGQVLNYWGNHVRRINFVKPFGGSYYNRFTRSSITFPYRNNSLNKDDYMEVQFNISQQITRSHGASGRSSYTVHHLSKDLRTFIRNHVLGVKVVDYTGYTNIINSDEHYVIKSIRKNRPAIVSGGSGHGRHAWVADGVVTIRVRRGFWFVKWTSHRHFIHMNWGWGATNGGWLLDNWYYNNGSDSYRPVQDTRGRFYEIFTMISVAP